MVYSNVRTYLREEISLFNPITFWRWSKKFFCWFRKGNDMQIEHATSVDMDEILDDRRPNEKSTKSETKINVTSISWTISKNSFIFAQFTIISNADILNDGKRVLFWDNGAWCPICCTKEASLDWKVWEWEAIKSSDSKLNHSIQLVTRSTSVVICFVCIRQC